ncbi:uncharacterized protein LOC120422921 [Culex pipiens pallens]|uniref:uncharacterized protein LOC120422921 n=1 Tax=Culex pipiens pallens TaxID=42434 RepID=UPI001953F454|nr:uncharacterized protein LOC120422921 [Culex pipiens pallens]
MNCALKIFSFLALVTLAASFPASISSQQNNGEHDLTSLTRVQQSSAPGTLPVAEKEAPVRSKRAIIFRPLFVYRQQEIKKQRLKEERQQKAQATAQPVPAGSNYAPNYYYKKNCNC